MTHQTHFARAYVPSRAVVSDFLWPHGCSLLGSSLHGILQARILEWITVPPPGDLPDPGIELMSSAAPALEEDSFTTEPWGKPQYTVYILLYKYVVYIL